MASRLISAIWDPRPRYQPSASPRADIADINLEAMVYILHIIYVIIFAC